MSLAATAIVKLLPEVLDAEVSVEQTCKLSTANNPSFVVKTLLWDSFGNVWPQVGESFSESDNDHDRHAWQTCFFNK